MAQKATQVLEDEHHIIQDVAASLATVGEDIETGKLVASKTLRNLAHFLEVFVAKCHHVKEEAYLFAILEKRGVPPGGCPLAVLSHEHAKLRALISQFVDSVELYISTHGEARTTLGKTINALLELIPGHIWKEDFLLLPMADKILTPEEQEILLAQFAQVESEIGPGIHHGFERLVTALGETVRFSRMCRETTSATKSEVGQDPWTR